MHVNQNHIKKLRFVGFLHVYTNILFARRFRLSMVNCIYACQIHTLSSFFEVEGLYIEGVDFIQKKANHVKTTTKQRKKP